jgi:hypothetical protein
MPLSIEAIAARAALGLREHAMRLVVADLLDADARGQGEIACAQWGTNYHVKLPSAIRVSSRRYPTFYHIELGN